MGPYLLVLFKCLILLLPFNHSMALMTSPSAQKDQSSSLTVYADNLSAATTATLTSTPQPACPSNAQCHVLGAECLQEISGCNQTCMYGEQTEVDVQVIDSVPCLGARNHTRITKCSFCYQLPDDAYSCSTNSSCRSIGTYASRLYRATCTVKSSILCFGKRRFYKNKLCHWTSGCSWSTAMVLSITLGGFGVDRFYLGYWKEGIGKLFSFGGMGVWTIMDVILISIGYISPSDGSLYTYRANLTS